MIKFSEAELYVGLGLSFIFSVGFVAILFRFARSDRFIDFRVLVILAAALMISVTFVGSAPYVSLIQNVIISLGLLAALYCHLTSTSMPNVKIVALLVVTMLACLLVNQASRSYDIGLLDWFDVTSAERAEAKELDAVADRVASLERSRRQLEVRLQEVEVATEIDGQSTNSTVFSQARDALGRIHAQTQALEEEHGTIAGVLEDLKKTLARHEQDLESGAKGLAAVGARLEAAESKLRLPGHPPHDGGPMGSRRPGAAVDGLAPGASSDDASEPISTSGGDAKAPPKPVAREPKFYGALAVPRGKGVDLVSTRYRLHYYEESLNRRTTSKLKVVDNEAATLLADRAVRAGDSFFLRLREPDGKPIGIFVVVHEITHRDMRLKLFEADENVAANK